MLVHTVLFWLRPMDAARREAFRAALETLAGIPDVTAVHVGTPAATPARPVIDASYDFCLTVLMPDMAAHNRYQSHPLHLAFLKAHGKDYERVLIYDAD